MREINNDVKRKLLRQLHVLPLTSMPLWNRFSMKTIKAIAVELERKMCYQTEVVVGEGEVVKDFLMLKEGRVQNLVSNFRDETKVVDELVLPMSRRPHKYLWVIFRDSIVQGRSSFTVKSKDNAILMRLPVDKAMEILKDDQTDYQIFCYFRDRVQLEGMGIFQKSCAQCPNVDHSSLHCPYYHYIPKRSIVICHHLHELSRKQENRVPFQRTKTKQNILKERLSLRLNSELYRRMNVICEGRGGKGG